ncbi:MAG: hypothetical protein IKY87_01130 [Paludibacteraceae bacterium]|nr:hypothetical protein [Paludibacteraceae bacterium]
MQAGVKHYNYYSTMRKYTDFFDYLKKEVKEQKHIDVIIMLCSAYSIGSLLDSAYFEFLRIGDGWYEMTVQKYVDSTYSIKLIINPQYPNYNERFA